MEAHPDLALYREALIVLGAAGIVIPLFHRLRVSAVLGFMLVGLAVGPFGLGALAGWVATLDAPAMPALGRRAAQWIGAASIGSPASIRPIAELGVVLLMFMIGLELSFERLWLMRRLVLGLGGMQLVLSAALLAGCARLLGLPAATASVAGLALAMSSTAVALQVLAEEKRLNTPAGRGSFAVLLFQDIAVVPVLFALGALAPATAPGPGQGGMTGFGLAVAQAVLAVAAILALGRLVLRPLFRSVARARSPEAFVAACLFVVVATALATAAAGLSMALGALLGGLLLAGTEYRRQVELTIEPFKGLLLGVFLISIGMGLDLRLAAAHPFLVIGAAAGLVAGKGLVVALLARLFGLSWVSGVQAGLLLGAGGEFSFVIVSVAAGEALLDGAESGFLLIVAALTMAAIPLLSKLGGVLTPRLSRRGAAAAALPVPDGLEAAPRVILAGFGRVGQTVAALLEVHDIAYIAVDSDPDRVAAQRKRGRPVYYGDMTRAELLHHLHLETARALVVTVDDTSVADRLVAAARAERDDLLIVSRARDAGHAARLYRAGASDAVPETIEASLQLAEAVLVDVGIPMGPVIATIHGKRAEFQDRIKAMAPGAEIRELGRRRLRDALQAGR